MAASPHQPEWQGHNSQFRRRHNRQCKGKETRKTIQFLIVIIFIYMIGDFTENSVVIATQSSPIPFQNTQPDGELTPWLKIDGSPQWYRVFTEIDDYTVAFNEKREEYVYATLDNGKIVSSDHTIGTLNSTQLDKLGIQPGLKPSPKELKKNCGIYCTDKTRDFDSKYNYFTIKGLTIHDTHPTRHRLLRSTSGKQVLRNIVILMKFADHTDRELPSLDDYSFLFNGESPTGARDASKSQVAPTGSVRDVFLTSSYGKLDIKSTVIGWVTLPEDEAYYADKKSGSSPRFEEALTYSLNIVDKVPNFSFDDYDMDNDKEIDSLVFIHSGYAAEWGAEDCKRIRVEDRIWSHKWRFKPAWESAGGVYKAVNYFTSSALWGSCGKEIARIGTLSHELGHVLDLPDLYLGGSGIGSYGLMGNSWGFKQDQLYPPILSSWSKITLEWMTPTIVEKSGRYTLPPIHDNPDALMIQVGFAQKEFLLIENRQAIGLEKNLPKGGLVIFHIDELAKFSKDPGWAGQAGWPENSNHYRVAILQADGEYHLEKGENRGDESDVFGPGDELRPGDHDLIYPNTDSYRRGKIKGTGIHVHDIKQNSDKSVSFSIDLPLGSTSKTASTAATFTTLPPQELVTTYAADIGARGCMFDIKAGSNPIIITSLDIHARIKRRGLSATAVTNLSVKVFAKEGSHVRFENRRELWTEICSTSVTPAGYFMRTIINEADFNSVTINENSIHAFYVVLGKSDLRYSMGKEVGSIAASNSDLKIFEGTGVNSEFGRSFSPRVFNGYVKYRVVAPPENGGLDVMNSQQEERTLTTNFSGSNGHYGNMFNIRAKSASVTVKGMDVHVRKKGSVPIEVWTKAGVYQTHERNGLEWELICNTNVIGKGKGNPTTIHPADFSPKTIEQGADRAFYVTVKTKGDIRYSTSRQSTTISDDIIEIKDGAGLNYPFGFNSNRIYQPRGFNGSINYSYSTSEVLAYAVAMHRKELLTTFAGENGSFGICFDVKAKNSITLVGIDIHVRATSQVSIELYTKVGSFVGHETNLNSWTQLCSVDTLGNGSFKRTSLPADCFSALAIRQGVIQGFYITLNSSDLRYTNEDIRKVGEIYKENDDIEVMIGTGIGNYPLVAGSTAIYPNRIFNGVLKYESTSHSASASQASASQRTLGQLQTTLGGGNYGFGNVFTVAAKDRRVEVLSIDIHTRISTGDLEVEMWTRPGSYIGYTNSMDGWVNVISVSVSAGGEGVLTLIDQQNFATVEILPYESQSFYVTLKSDELVYTNGSGLDTSDNAIIIYEGLGIYYFPLQPNTRTFHPRVFNGNINYAAY